MSSDEKVFARAKDLVRQAATAVPVVFRLNRKRWVSVDCRTLFRFMSRLLRCRVPERRTKT